MSNLTVANVSFEATEANRIDYVGGNLRIVTANTVVPGRLKVTNNLYSNNFLDSSNTSYYCDPAGASKLNALRPAGLTMGNIRYISKNGANIILMVIDDKIFTTVGAPTQYGNYSSGRGGNQTSATYGLTSFKLVNFPDEAGAVFKAGVYGYSAYALFTSGNLYTWGYNGTGQLGVGDTTDRIFPILAAQMVADVYEPIATSDEDVSYARLFIRKSDSYIYATGYNGYGQLGDGTTTQRTVFTQLTGLGTSVVGVYPVGNQYGFTFFQKSDNSIWACGRNSFGELGNGNTTPQYTPVNVTTAWGGAVGSGRVIEKICGSSCLHNAVTPYSYGWVCMLLDDGTTTYLRSAGYNGYGSIGNGTVADVGVSTPITPNVGAGRISTISGGGTGAGTIMVLKENGEMYNWGYNVNGQLGNGTNTNNGTPTLRDTGVTAIYGECCSEVEGYVSAMFYAKGAALYGSGYNGYFQLGVGDTTSRNVFTRVWLPADFTVSMLGGFFATYPTYTYLAVGTDGRMFGWGYNGLSEISARNPGNNCYSPIQINPLLGA